MPHQLRARWPLGLLLAACVGLAALPVQADDRKADETVAKLYHRLLRSSLWVGARATKPGEEGKASWHTGSGSFIDLKNRYVLTNWHVVQAEDVVFVCFPTYVGPNLVQDRAFYVKVLQGGGGGRGKVIARDAKRDLAVIQMLQVPAGAMALPMAKDGVKVGDRVHSIGNPGEEDKLWICTSRTAQKISVLKLMVKEEGVEHRHEARMIQTDVPSKKGESGGPLINDRGELVGVTQGYREIDDKRLGLYIDLSEVKAFLEENDLWNKISPPADQATKEPIKPPPDKTVDKPPVKPDPKPLSKAEEEEKAAERDYRFAKNLIEAGKTARAKEVLQDLIRSYPKTITAKQAKLLLETLK